MCFTCIWLLLPPFCQMFSTFLYECLNFWHGTKGCFKNVLDIRKISKRKLCTYWIFSGELRIIIRWGVWKLSAKGVMGGVPTCSSLCQEILDAIRAYEKQMAQYSVDPYFSYCLALKNHEIHCILKYVWWGWKTLISERLCNWDLFTCPP